MDNTGGHGTNEAKEKYTKILKLFHIEIIWQVPRSPETNMLDLGCWMSIQSAVVKNIGEENVVMKHLLYRFKRLGKNACVQQLL